MNYRHYRTPGRMCDLKIVFWRDKILGLDRLNSIVYFKLEVEGNTFLITKEKLTLGLIPHAKK